MRRETCEKSLRRPRWRERHASRRTAALHRVAHLAVRPVWDRGEKAAPAARQESHGGRTVLGAVLAGGLVGGLVTGAWVEQRRESVAPPVVEVAEPVELLEEETLPEQVADGPMLSDEEALAQARSLGLLEVIQRTRPTMREPLVHRLGTALVREAAANGLDPLLLAAVAKVESHFNPFATSVVGARGVLQVRPMTGRWVLSADGETLVGDDELYDIETNVALGARYLASLIKRSSSLARALVAYNRGPTGAKRALSGPDAKQILDGYPRKVLTALHDLRARAALAANEAPVAAPAL